MKDLLPLKVATRYLGNKLADSIGDPPELLREFERALKDSDVPGLAKAKEIIEDRVKNGVPPDMVGMEAYKIMSDASDYAYKAYFRATKHNRLLVPGGNLFLAIIQTYNLPPALRKKIEIASRAYLKVPNPRFKAKSGPPRYLEMIQFYEKFMAMVNDHLTLAKQAIALGKKHTDEGEGATKMKAGAFMLINTGGFSEEQMKTVASLAEKATSLARASGLGEVCYGDIQVTNTLKDKRVVAFYLIAKDELFVRANVKATEDTLQTILHELGHRYEHKFLKRKAGAELLYRILSGQERQRTFKEPKKPSPGDTVTIKGTTFVVERVSLMRGFKGYTVEMHYQDDPKKRAGIALDAFWAHKGEVPRDFRGDPEFIGFVTDYAKRGGPGENFAEMFAYYCMGDLPVKQAGPFEEIVFGTEKTAAERLHHRVSVRSARA